MAESVNTKAVRIAAAMLGGPEELAAHLGVPASRVSEWLSGAGEPPADTLHRLLDLILDDMDQGYARLSRIKGGIKGRIQGMGARVAPLRRPNRK